MANPMTEQQPPRNPQGRHDDAGEAKKQHIELEGFPARIFFGLFDDRYVADEAAHRIQDAGVDVKDVEILAGRDGVARLEPSQGAKGFFDRLVQAAQELSDFKTFLADCAATVKSGKALLLVRFEDEEGRTAIESIVRQGGGAPLAYTDEWTLVKYS